MRLKSLAISWFRGAADEIVLELSGNSAVVYGPNGSGKSSFVDAIEYAIHGKIAHLSHEYSGKKQERGVQNTHRKPADDCVLCVSFQDDSSRRITFAKDGSASSVGAEVPLLSTWDYRRTILRQDEVSAFIRDTKGEKYSALLPLLGLSDLELAAENLHQLANAVEETTGLRELLAVLEQTRVQRLKHFGADTPEQIADAVRTLFNSYCSARPLPERADAQATQVLSEIDTRIAASSADLREFVAVQSLALLNIQVSVISIAALGAKLSAMTEPMLEERLAILEASIGYVSGIAENEDVTCPACGSAVGSADFKLHVEAERVRLTAIIAISNERKAAIGLLCDDLATIKTTSKKPEFVRWVERESDRAPCRKYVDSLDVAKVRSSCTEADLDNIEEHVVPLIAAAAVSAVNAPADAKQLSLDRQRVEVAISSIREREQALVVARSLALKSYLLKFEQSVRACIKQRAGTVIADISTDVQGLWALLHPGKPIDDVTLCMPPDVDKALDIRLSFHGVAQDSPRLTLSEGYRNSLGLCIFLAMARREAGNDLPLILDDVIVSLDRHHRGLLIDLLRAEFSTRQIIVLTHDREWFTELRQRLAGSDWLFRRLLPYESPKVGIRWSHSTATFDDAKAHLATRPDSAGNDARKIMDIELALIVEKLQIRLPYLRGERNDMRMAHELIERIVSDGKKCFQHRENASHTPHPQALVTVQTAGNLLAAWGNRGSHTFDLELSEATKLIEACEAALAVFACGACKKPVWFAEAGGPEWIQCECGALRWRYGKG